MKITMSWPGNRKTPKEKRVVHKPKIRWQQLGLKDLSEEPASISMDEIRRQVVVMSGRGLGHGLRARAGEPSGPATGARPQGKASRTKRHEAPEQN